MKFQKLYESWCFEYSYLKLTLARLNKRDCSLISNLSAIKTNVDTCHVDFLSRYVTSSS